MKTYLKTPTSELTVRQIRTIVCETIRWCETNLGTKSYGVNYCVRTLRNKYEPAYGMYDYTNEGSVGSEYIHEGQHGQHT